MKCFKVYVDEIEGRIDPFYYKEEFRKIIKALKDGKYQFVELGVIAGVQGGYAFSSGDYLYSDGIPLLRIQNISDEEVNLSETVYLPLDYKDKFSSFLLRESDVVIAMTGATIGKIGRVDRNNLPCLLNQRVGRVQIKDKNSISEKYLYSVLALSLFREQIIRLSLGGAQPNISGASIESIKIPLPSLENQNRIVHLMDNAYKIKRQKESEAQQLLGSINDYVLDELGIKLPEVDDKKCFVVYADEVEDNRLDGYYYQPKFKEIEKALEGGKYGVKQLKEFITKIHYGVSIKNVYVDKGIPLLRILNLKASKIDLTDVIKLPEFKRKEIGNAFVYEGDILISRSGSVGIVAVVPKEADGFAFGSFMIKFCVNEKISKEYVSIWLNSQIYQMFIEREKIGAIQGNITIPTIESFEIPFPSLQIQNKIAEEVKTRMQRAEQLKKEAKMILAEAKARVEKIILGREESD